MKHSTRTLLVLLSLVFSACQSSSRPLNDYEQGNITFECESLSLMVGESSTTTYKLTPIGTACDLSLESLSNGGFVSIENGLITALTPGEAEIKATARSKEGAIYPFELNDTFTVSVTKPNKEEGEFLENSSFEYGFYGWTLEPSNPNSEFNTIPLGNTAHTGENALNLWSKVSTDGEYSDPLDLTVSQNVTLPRGDYLFSLWYKGDIGTLTMTALNDKGVIVSEEFDAQQANKLSVEGHNGYVQYGVAFELNNEQNIKLSIHTKADYINNWGLIDDVSLKVGDLYDLVRPANEGDDEFNFVSNSDIVSDVNVAWINVGDEISRGASNGTYINCYGSEGGNFEFYQVIENLPNLTYTASLKVIGSGEFVAETSECFLYVADTSGNILHKVDFELPDYQWKRTSLRDISLNGNIRLGIKIVSSTRVWAGLTDFRLFSEGYEPPKSPFKELTNLSVCGVSATQNGDTFAVTLPTTSLDTLKDSSSDVRGLIEATISEKASITSAVFDVATNVLSITVTAEDETTKVYIVTITEKKEPKITWVDSNLTNGSFDEATNGAANGWTTTNLKDYYTSSSQSRSGRCIRGYGNVLTPGTPASVCQTVEGTYSGGTLVKVSTYVSTKYGEKVTSFRLLVGNQAIECDSLLAGTSSYQLAEYTFTLTAEDIVDNKVIVGFEFTMVSGGWINIDDFDMKIGMVED